MFFLNSDIKSINDLANQNEIPYGTVEGSAVWQYFTDHQDDLYYGMAKYMEEKQTTVHTTQEGIKRVHEGYGKKSKGEKKWIEIIISWYPGGGGVFLETYILI